MPVELTDYSDGALLDWMAGEVGEALAGVLGWSEPALFEPMLAATVRLAGLSDVAAATDEDWLLACARAALWSAARRALVSAVNLRYPDGESADRATLYTHAAAEADRAEAALLALRRTRGGVPALTRVPVRHRSAFADPLGASRRRRPL